MERKNQPVFVLIPIVFLLFVSISSTDKQEFASKEIHVSDFGAFANDGKDDTESIQKAIDQSINSSENILIFENGKYDIGEFFETQDGKKRSLKIDNKINLRFVGNGAELVGHTLAGMFEISSCDNLSFEGLSIDWDPLPFTAGEIINRSHDYIDVKVSEGHQVQEGRVVEAIMDYDPEKGHLAYRGIDEYQTDYKRKTEIVSPGVVRIFLKTKFPKSNFVVARHVAWGGNVFNLKDCKDVKFERINVYTVPGMGIYAKACTNLYMHNYHVMIKPGSGRWMSATADALHISDSRGEIEIKNCLFEGHGDDAGNIRSGHYMAVLSRTGKNGVSLIEFGHKKSLGIPAGLMVGDSIEFGDGDNPLIPYYTGKVKAIQRDEVNQIARVIFTEDLPEQIERGALAANASSCPKLTISNCEIRNNRARGFLLKTRDVTVEKNTFKNISGSALLIRCDNNYWWESISSRNVKIQHNNFENCNFGAVRREAVITVTAQTQYWYVAAAGVHKGIDILANKFIDADGTAVHIESAEDVRIAFNVFDNPTNQAISIKNCRELKISENTLKNAKKGINFNHGVEMETVQIFNNQGF